MNNFIGVGKASLNFRLLPRILSVFILALIITAISATILQFLKISNFIMLSMLVGLIFFGSIGLIVYLLAFLEYSNLKYMIEQNSLILKEGVFSVDTETIPYQKIRNASITQSFLQRLYGVGNVVIDQDPETYTWESIDNKTAQTIIEAVSERSNIQPIQVSEGQPNPYQVK